MDPGCDSSRGTDRCRVLKCVREGGEIKVEDDGSMKGGGKGHVLSRSWFLPSNHASGLIYLGQALEASRELLQDPHLVHSHRIQNLLCSRLIEVLLTSRLKGKLK